MSLGQRATFEAFELAVTLSHYDLGVLESITDFPRGSSRSAKVGVVAERGKFMLKRRACSRAHPDLVSFSHRVQRHVRSAGFPAPALVLVRDGQETFVQIRDQVYELFEFIAGSPYRRTIIQAREAGSTLARFHAAARGFTADTNRRIPHGDFHDTNGVSSGLCSIGSTLSSHESFSGDEAELASLVQVLLESYEMAGKHVGGFGFDSFEERFIHADWHPGNLLFRNDQVVGVVDYDSVRRSRTVIDLANGALQFSMTARGDPATWPDHIDLELFRAFVNGYDAQESITHEERRCIPYLMMEALIAECVSPITATGSVGRWSGFRVLKMVRRKVDWLTRYADELSDPPDDR